MNILLIGNGFDLAHCLPTKYTQFLDFILIVGKYTTNKSRKDVILKNKINEELNQLFGDAVNLETPGIIIHFDEAEKFIDKNIWVEYMLIKKKELKEGWIDFEKEISDVIQSLDDDMSKESKSEEPNPKVTNPNENKSKDPIKKTIKILSNSAILKKHKYNDIITFENLRDRLVNDLNRLILLLELYLSHFVYKIKPNYLSSDIKIINPEYILSFNYTDTYRFMYKEDNPNYKDISFIHGSIRGIDDTKPANIVLGIDEYLKEDRKDKDIDFIAFKKYYQRILKRTGSEYKNWLGEIHTEFFNFINNNDSRKNKVEKLLGEDKNIILKNVNFELIDELGYKHKRSKLHIFGHSLDVTDKDILKELILDEFIDTTVYYFREQDLPEKIANLVKIIGQDELIKRTSAPYNTISFQLQRAMQRVSI